MNLPSTTRFTALLGVLLLLGAATAPAIGVTGEQTGELADGTAVQSHTASNDSLEPADEVYVKDNGDVVLYYESEESDPTDADSSLEQMKAGLNVSQGLVHVLLEGEGIEENGTGSFEAILDEQKLAADGSISVPSVSSNMSEDEQLAFDLSGELGQESAALETSFNGTVEADGPDVPGDSSVKTNGTVETSPSSLSVSSSFATRNLSDSSIPEGIDASVSLSETDTGYDVSVERNYVVAVGSEGNWNTRANATQTLENRYQSIADGLGGSATVTVDSYSYTEAQSDSDLARHRLDISYSLSYENVEERAAELVVERMAQDTTDETATERDALEQQIIEMDVTTLDGSLTVEEASSDGSVALEIEGLDGVTHAILDLSEASSELDQSERDALDSIRTNLDAQQAANLKTTMSWTGSMETEGDLTSLGATFDYETENWGAYVDELESDGIDLPDATSTIDVHAVANSQRTHANASVTFQQEELLKQGLDQAIAAAKDDPETDESTLRFLNAFEEAGFDRAKTNMSFSGDEVTMRGAARFENITAFKSALEDGDSNLRLASGAIRTSGEAGMYLTVNGAVGASADESDVRSLSYVESDTTVHLAGDWDREFPSMDVASVNDYLAPDSESGEPSDAGNQSTTTEEETSSSGLPGFGVPATLVALLVTVGVLARRRSA